MTDKPQILPPTLRERKRYLAFKVISEQKLNYNDLSIAIWHAVLNFMGEFGTGEADIWIIKDSYKDDEQTGIVKCDHLAVDKVRAALALVQRIGDTRVVIRVLGISGTINATKKKFFGEKDLANYT